MAPSPGPAPAPTPDLAAVADRSWEGLVRRREGVSLFRGRWDEGQLAFRAGTLSWTDADETKENVSLAGRTIREQFLVCLKGAVTIVLDDGQARDEVRLDTPQVGLHIPPMVWGIQYRFSADAVMLVLASDTYDAADYIRNYDDFLAAVKADAA